MTYDGVARAITDTTWLPSAREIIRVPQIDTTSTHPRLSDIDRYFPELRTRLEM